MPTIYGAGGTRAFARLQEEIMRRMRDHSILAWGFNHQQLPADHVTQKDVAPALAISPLDFAHSGDLVPRYPATSEFASLDISGGCLSASVVLHEHAGEWFGLLDCSPDEDEKLVVGISLASIKNSNEYVRRNTSPSLFVYSDTFDREFVRIRLDNTPLERLRMIIEPLFEWRADSTKTSTKYALTDEKYPGQFW